MNTAFPIGPVGHLRCRAIPTQATQGSNRTVQQPNRHIAGHNTQRWLIAIILVSIFGPYVFPSARVRTEQLAIYGCAAISCFLDPRALVSPRRSIRALFVLWGLIGITASLVTLSNATTGLVWGQFFGGLDHFLSALAVMVVVNAYFWRLERSRATLRDEIGFFGRVLIFLLSANTAVELCQLLFGLPFSQHLSVFWTGHAYNFSTYITQNAVGVNAVSMGRFTGVFNQPSEQGIAYGAGVILWLYSFSLGHRRVVNYLLLSGLLIGGVLGVSKIFLLGCIPLTILYIGYSQVSRTRKSSMADFVGLAGAIFVCIAFGLRNETQSWSGFKEIANLTDYESQGILSTVTAGRFHSAGEGAVAEMFRQVWEAHPITGGGFGYLEVSDNAYLHAYMVAGMVGLGVYLLLLCVLASPLWVVRVSRIERPRKLLYGALILFLVGSGMGVPTLSVNRSATIMWIVVILLNRDLRLMGKRRRAG